MKSNVFLFFFLREKGAKSEYYILPFAFAINMVLIYMCLLLVKPTTVNFLRLFAFCGRARSFLRLLADRILNSLHLELLALKAQFNFFLPLACSCGARTSCATSCACIVFGLYCMLCRSVHWDNINALSDCFNMTLTDILDKHAPRIPWFNDDIKLLKHRRRRLEKKALKTDLPGDWNNYHKVRNQYSALIKSARVKYYSTLIDQCAGDSRKLFHVVNSLSWEPFVGALPEHDDPTKLANEFGTFIKKIEIIKENLDKFQVQEPRLAPATPKENLENFSSVSIEEVCKIVRESSNASCRLDPVPTWLVKSCLDVLAPSITEMVNLSLLSGCVPENWRTAVVIPLLKKPGLDNNNNNTLFHIPITWFVRNVLNN